MSESRTKAGNKSYCLSCYHIPHVICQMLMLVTVYSWKWQCFFTTSLASPVPVTLEFIDLVPANNKSKLFSCHIAFVVWASILKAAGLNTQEAAVRKYSGGSCSEISLEMEFLFSQKVVCDTLKMVPIKIHAPKFQFQVRNSWLQAIKNYYIRHFLKYFMSHQITKLSEAADLGGRAVVKKDFKK